MFKNLSPNVTAIITVLSLCCVYIYVVNVKFMHTINDNHSWEDPTLIKLVS